MKIRQKRFVAWCMVLCMVLLSACSGNKEIIKTAKGQVNIRFSWWGNDVRNEYTLKAIREFEKLHPDIHVDCDYSEWSGYEKRYDIQVHSNTEADVMQINYAWLSHYLYSNKDNYYNLDSLSEEIGLDNFDPAVLEYGKYENTLYAVPIALNTQTIYINRTIYEKYGLDVPKTWDDFFDAAKVMNGKTYPLSGSAKSIWFLCVAYAEDVTGKQFCKADGSLNFGAEEFAVCFSFYKRLVEEKVIPKMENFDKLKIASGEYAGCISWLSDAESYCGEAADKGNDIIVAPYPTAGNGSSLNWYIKPATMYAISGNTEHPKEAAMLLDFLLNSEEMSNLQGIEKGIPLSKSAYTYVENMENEQKMQYAAYEKMNEDREKMKLIAPDFEDAGILETFSTLTNDVVFDKKSAEDCGNLLAKYTKQVFEEK